MAMPRFAQVKNFQVYYVKGFKHFCYNYISCHIAKFSQNSYTWNVKG